MGQRDRAGQRPRERLVIAGGTVTLAGLLAFGLVPHGKQPSTATDPASASAAGSVPVLAPSPPQHGAGVEGRWSAATREIPLGAHNVIQLDVDAVVAFRTYTFAAGLQPRRL
jgi:hypothetical protein